MLEFLKAPFLVLYFPYYALMAFLEMLSAILLSVLIILLSTLSVIRHRICSNNYNWLLNLNLIYETPWTGAGSGWFISVFEKPNWFRLTGLLTLVLLMWKWMCLFWRKNHLWKFWGWLSILNGIGALTSSLLLIAKSASREIGALIGSIKFLSPEVAVSLWIYHTVIHGILLSRLCWYP